MYLISPRKPLHSRAILKFHRPPITFFLSGHQKKPHKVVPIFYQPPLEQCWTVQQHHIHRIHDQCSDFEVGAVIVLNNCIYLTISRMTWYFIHPHRSKLPPFLQYPLPHVPYNFISLEKGKSHVVSWSSIPRISFSLTKLEIL